jgi:hypothetical protein
VRARVRGCVREQQNRDMICTRLKAVEAVRAEAGRVHAAEVVGEELRVHALERERGGGNVYVRPMSETSQTNNFKNQLLQHATRVGGGQEPAQRGQNHVRCIVCILRIIKTNLLKHAARVGGQPQPAQAGLRGAAQRLPQGVHLPRKGCRIQKGALYTEIT